MPSETLMLEYAVSERRRAPVPAASSAAFLAACLPHLAQARRLARSLAALHARDDALRRTLDRFDTGLFVVLSNAELLHCNRAGAAFTERADVLALDAGGKLVAIDPTAADALARAMDRVATAGASSRDGTEESLLLGRAGRASLAPTADPCSCRRRAPLVATRHASTRPWLCPARRP